MAMGKSIETDCWFCCLGNENSRVIILFFQAVTIGVTLVYLERLPVAFKLVLLSLRRGAGISLSALAF